MLLLAMFEQLSNQLFETADMLMWEDAICKMRVISWDMLHRSNGEMMILTKGILSEKSLAGIDCVECGIAKEYFGLDQRMLVKEIL